MPFLKGLFFEQNLMTKTQWNEIKDLFDWTEEILPVAFWNNTIFIGCVEPPKTEIKILDFETRYVLTAYQSLRIMWKFVQSLSHFIEREVTRSIAFDQLDKKLKALDSITPSEKPLDKVVNAEPMMSQGGISPSTPSEKPLDKAVNAEPMMSQGDISSSTSSQKPLDKAVNAEPMMSQGDISPSAPSRSHWTRRLMRSL